MGCAAEGGLLVGNEWAGDSKSYLRPWHTDSLGVVALALVKGIGLGKSLCSCAPVLPHSRRRWPTKCLSHDNVVFFCVCAHRSRNAPHAVMELRLGIACPSSR